MGATRTFYDVATDGRHVYTAIARQRDLEGHVIAQGDLHTLQKVTDSAGDPTWKRSHPVCRECRPFELVGLS